MFPRSIEHWPLFLRQYASLKTLFAADLGAGMPPVEDDDALVGNIIHEKAAVVASYMTHHLTYRNGIHRSEHLCLSRY
jgi:hypothetical protein